MKFFNGLMSHFLSIFNLFLFLLGLLAPSGYVFSKDHCAPVLEAAQVARQDFAGRLKSYPPQTSYDKYEGNIDNYNIGISENKENYIVIFKLRPLGSGIKGGGAIYKIEKKGLKIRDFIGQE